MRLCVERVIAPRRGRLVDLDLPPIADAADIASAMAAITTQVAEGTITPAEGAEVAMMVKTYLSGARGERLRQTADGAGSHPCDGFLTPHVAEVGSG
jgi:hypothetical protein